MYSTSLTSLPSAHGQKMTTPGFTLPGVGVKAVYSGDLGGRGWKGQPNSRARRLLGARGAPATLGRNALRRQPDIRRNRRLHPGGQSVLGGGRLVGGRERREGKTDDELGPTLERCFLQDEKTPVVAYGLARDREADPGARLLRREEGLEDA